MNVNEQRRDVSLRLFIYAIYNSESLCSLAGIQLIFAKMSLTEELIFNRAGTDRQMEEKNDRKRVSKGQT